MAETIVMTTKLFQRLIKPDIAISCLTLASSRDLALVQPESNSLFDLPMQLEWSLATICSETRYATYRAR